MSWQPRPSIVIWSGREKSIMLQQVFPGPLESYRGRAEVVKLLCSAKNIPYEVVDVDFQNMKTDRVAYPFGQCECVWCQ